MIDSIFVAPAVHMAVGSLVLLTNLIFLITVAWLVWQKKEFSPLAGFFFVLFQAALMLQALIGIKLLDQGLGHLQLYIHYLGGLAPLAFCLIYYWLPTPEGTAKNRRLLVIAIASFFFVLLTFAVGSMYTP
ncbi:MAG: hypothetical protein DHS20C20_18110 [Ardenticatenaceae bacterium]|nr:MAG: hypothetical protein DHS20C20_18110 [Ardenticatenaceae bacterium]